MKTAWFACGVVLMAAALMAASGSMSVAQAPNRQPSRQIGAPPGGGEQPVNINRAPTRRVQGGPGATPQADPQTGQIRIQRQTIREGLRRIPVRPSARWRIGINTDNAPLGLLITGVSRNSPASRFGLEPGDYLLDVMGYPVGFYRNQYYPVADAFNQLARRDGWVNILIWNRRTNAEEAMWIQLEPRQGQVPGLPFRVPGRSSARDDEEN